MGGTLIIKEVPTLLLLILIQNHPLVQKRTMLLLKLMVLKRLDSLFHAGGIEAIENHIAHVNRGSLLVILWIAPTNMVYPKVHQAIQSDIFMVLLQKVTG
jgi:hypothetical protein